jgi:hypothetical protein
MKINVGVFIFVLSALDALIAFCYGDTATCRVLDPAGKPVANATVYVTDNPFDPTDAKTLTCDNSGNFSVDLDEFSQYNLCTADAPGFAPSTIMDLTPGDHTLSLLLPSQISGSVVDKNGLPVVGAIVSAEYALQSTPKGLVPQHLSFFRIGALADRYTVKTDSNGRYTLSNVPPSESIMVQMSDPKYVSNVAVSGDDAKTIPPLIALPGTTISGRVIRQDGMPQPGAIVSVGQGFGLPAMAKTAADGTYKISGLSPGTYKLIADDAGVSDLIDPDLVSVIAVLGKTNTAPDIVLTPGGIATGSVLDSDTKAPIAGVHIIFDDPDSMGLRTARAVTNKNGVYTVHVWNGDVQCFFGSVPKDYPSNVHSVRGRFSGINGKTVTVDPILVGRARPEEGSVTDDNGNPVPSISLTLQKTGDFENDSPSVNVDSKGAFSIYQLEPGDYWFDPGANWAVVSPPKITVPMSGRIKLVLKRNVAAPLSGTVVDTFGAPVPNVNIALTVSRRLASGDLLAATAAVSSAADGTYSLPDVPLDPALIQRTGSAKDGYVYKSGGNATLVNGKLVMSPIVMSKLVGKVDGTLRNSLGKAVPFGWVYCGSPGGDDLMPVETDAAGRFELNNLELGIVTIAVAKNLYAGRADVHASVTPGNSTVQLGATPSPPIGPSNLAKAMTMLASGYKSGVSQQDNSDDRAARVIAEVSPDAAVKYILSASSIDTNNLDDIVSVRLKEDPLGIAKWALVPLEKMSGNDRRAAIAAKIGIAAAYYDKAAAQPYYEIATKNTDFSHLDIRTIDDAMSVTAFAYILNKPEADSDYSKVRAALAAIVAKSKDDPTLTFSANWLPISLVKNLAPGNAKLALSMLDGLPADIQDQIVPPVVRQLAETNPAGALDFYHWLDSQKDHSVPSLALETSLATVLPIIYKTDPSGALKLARGITNAGQGALSLTELADLMPLSASAPIYQEALQTANAPINNTCSSACVAYHAWRRDPILGEKLFKSAYKMLLASPIESPYQGIPRSDFAFYYAHIDPGFSRLLIERQFIKDNVAQTSYGETNSESVIADIAAMSSIDMNRAVGLVNIITDPDSKTSAALKSAQYQVLTPQQRSTLSFSKWAYQSNWSAEGPPPF